MMKVDIAIITIRPDEFVAVRERFQTEQQPVSGRAYLIGEVKTHGEQSYTIAITRCSDQGNDVSQKLASEVIHDLDPQLILVVGIAGGVPHNEFTLGDVVLSNRIVNPNIDAWLPDGTIDYAIRGGPPHPLVEQIIKLLPGDPRLVGWEGSIQLERPRLDPNLVNIEGDNVWHKRVRESLDYHFTAEEIRDRLPIFTIGSILSSNHLMKDPVRLRELLKTNRSILAVEMEAAGVYEAAMPHYPIMAIRGISDIVGLQRDSQWTAYACRIAAAFTETLIKILPIEPRARSGYSSGTPPSALSAGTSKTPPKPHLLQKPPIIGLFVLLILLSILLVPTLLAHFPAAPSLAPTIGQAPNVRVHLQELHPYCESSDGANWSVFNPQASCSDSTSSLIMHQTKLQYSEVDLLSIRGYSYHLTNFQVTVQATLQGQDDGETYAALIVQTPAGALPTGNDGGYVLAVKPTGAWRLQHIADFNTIQSDHVSSLDPTRPITIGITGKNNVLDLYIYQSNAPLSSQSPVYSYDEPDGSFSPQGVVGLMVQHDGKPFSSTIEFTNFTLDIPG